jgi:argininosuccinate synthase
MLEDPMVQPDESMFKMSVSPMAAPDKKEKVRITFKAGVPVAIKNLTDGTEHTEPLAIFE